MRVSHLTDFAAIADFRDSCGESPLWHDKEQALYWTDITTRRFYRYDWNTKQAAVLSSNFEVCGFAFNGSSGFVAVNSQGIWLWDGKTEPTVVAVEVDGIACRMNDCAADPARRLLAGSCFFTPDLPDYPLGHLISVDHDGSLRVLDDGIHLANGIGFSPDTRTLYFADSIARVIYAYDYDPSTGTPSNRREFVRIPLTEGLPDGLTVDAEGFVWSAQWFGSCIVRYDPDGSVERRITMPARQITSLAFGGPQYTDMFVTSAELPDCVLYAPKGYDPYQGNNGGALFLGSGGIAGRAEYRCDIKPTVFETGTGTTSSMDIAK